MEQFGKKQNNLTWLPSDNATDKALQAGPVSEGEFLRDTLLCPLIAPSAPLQVLCVLQVHPWVLPQAFLQLFGGSLGSPM